MTARLVHPIEGTDDDECITVDQAGRRLGCDPSTVRALLRRGHLAGHKVGKGDRPGGVRVSVASIRAYKSRHSLGATPLPPAEPDAPPPSPRPSAAYREAMARLRAIGAL